ncbi:hypothetical protein ACWGE1_06700 [Streptomyces sp. NPDC054932]
MGNQVGNAAAGKLEARLKADLTEVGLLYDELSPDGKPSLRSLARETGVSATTIGLWLKGRRVPRDFQALATLISLIGHAAHHGRARTGGLLDVARWEAQHRKLHRARLDEAEQLRLGTDAATALTNADFERRRHSLTDRPRPVGAWTAADLGVHPSITGSTVPRSRRTPGFNLPAYHLRPHDTELRAAVEEAASGSKAVLVVVRAESSAGKTRSAYEALQAVEGVRDWDLIFPRTTASALEVLKARAVTPRTVLWLDDAHRLFTGGGGEELAAALRTRQAEGGPVLLLATIWTNSFRDLTARIHTNGQAWLLLSGADTVVDVPALFTEEDMHALGGAEDPALLVARSRARDGRITQTLSAGLELADRYDNAQDVPACYGRAVITAAMDATRFGWDGAIAHRFLEDAAPGYLTDGQRAAAHDDWFTDALTTSRAKVLDVVAPLEPVPRPGAMGAQPDVSRLTDYLDAHGRAVRRRASPPAAFWDAAVQHATDVEALVGLSLAAADRRRFKAAELLARKAADAGCFDGLWNLFQTWTGWGRLDEARDVARICSEYSADFPLEQCQIEDDLGNYAEAERLFHRSVEVHGTWVYRSGRRWVFKGDWIASDRIRRAAAEAGDGDAASELAVESEEADRPEESEHFARLAADGGSSVYGDLARRRLAAGDCEGAERIARMAADGGDASVYRELVMDGHAAGDHARTERLARLAADAGHPDLYLYVAELRASSGDLEKDEYLTRLAAEAGHAPAYARLALLRDVAGDSEGAEGFVRLAGESGHPKAYLRLAQLRIGRGDAQGAELVARSGADAGYPPAHVLLAGLREIAGDREGAELHARLGSEAGVAHGYRHLAELRERMGNREGAEEFARLAAAAGRPDVYGRLAELREAAGDQEGAARMAAEARRAGDPGTLGGPVARRGEPEVSAGHLSRICLSRARLRMEAGDTAEAERLYRLALEGGEPEACNPEEMPLADMDDASVAREAYDGLVRLREQARDRSGADSVVRRAADAGHPSVYDTLIHLREKAGDGIGAEQLARHAADAGHADSYAMLARMREEAGDEAEASRLYRVRFE